MTNAPDRQLVRLFNLAPAEHRDRLAVILGSGDFLARHLTMADAPRAILAAWLTYATAEAHRTGDPAADALADIATHVLDDVGGRMAVIADLADAGVDPDVGHLDGPQTA